MKEKLFPNFVCRVSGLPTEMISNLSSEKLKKLVIDIFNVDQEINKLKEVISNELHELISQAEEKSTRNKIIKLRRDIYNKKEIDVTKIISSNGISEKCIPLIREYSRLIKSKQRLLSKYERVYQQEIIRIRDTFKYQLQDEYFQKGLLISSDSLFNSQGNYINTDSQNLNGKQEQIERGLLRYYSRMAMKATPFGTFCSIIPGVIEEDLPFDYQFTSDVYPKKSLVLINKWLYGALTRFIKYSSELKPYINLELNPTVVKKENQLVFLASINESEIFQHVEINEVIDLLYEHLKKYSEIRYCDLVNEIGKIDDIEATEEEITEYLNGLINIGLLRYKFGIADQEEDWDKLLLKIVEKIPNENASIITDFLKTLRNKKEVFKKSLFRTRGVILEEIKKLIDETFTKLEIKEKLHNDLPLYEDSTGNSVLKLNSNLFESSLPKMVRLLNIMRQTAYPRTDNISMRHFYDTYYKDKSDPVKLLDFYEDYYREHYKAHLEKEQQLKLKPNDEEVKGYNVANPFNLEAIKKIHRSGILFHDLIVQKWIENPNGEQISIEEKDIKELCPDIPEVISPRHSVSSFLECALSDNGSGNNNLIYPHARSMLGFGKYFSRFLKLFDEEHQSKVYENNICDGEVIFAEICGDANFNANLHPPLLKYEISYPTGEGGNSPEKIATSDIVVVPSEEDPNALYLRRLSDCTRIVPLDVGFLNPNMRPPLFQLISKFCVPANSGLQIPQNMVLRDKLKVDEKKQSDSEVDNENSEIKQSGIMSRPRIVYENEIILARKCWIVPFGLFPLRNNEETDNEYCLRLNLWRIENNIPSEIYVKIKPLPLPKQNADINNEEEQKKGEIAEKETKPEQSKLVEGEEKKDEDTLKQEPAKLEEKKQENQKQKQRKSRDYYKPQYIDFSNPLFCNLFGKMPVNLKNFTVTIEERFPKKEQLLKYGNKSYATEFIMQIDFFDKSQDELEKAKTDKFIGVK